MKKTIFIITGLIVLSFYACQKYDDPDVKYASTYPISGEWWVRFTDTSGTVLVDYTKLLTYNTRSEKGDSIWIDDGGNIWLFKIKAACDVKNKTFAVDSIVNTAMIDETTPYPIKIMVSNGIVVLNGAKTKAGNTTDSIYMRIGFEDDQGTTYIISGVRRTGFREDDY
jgi:hypothetical protein